MVRLLFFGRLTDIAGCEPRDYALPDRVTDIAALRDWLGAGEPALAEALASSGVRAVVDDAIVADTHRIVGASEISFLPPVSGG